MDAAVMACLKDLPLRLQTSQLRVRKEIFQDLTNLFNEHELPENVVKGVCKVLSVTLPRYQDAASRRLVVDFIRVALAKSPEAVARAIHTSLLEAVGGWREATPTRALAKLALGGMAWSCLALAGCPTLLDTEGKKILEVHGILLPLVRCGGAPRQLSKLDRLLRGLWTLEDVKGRYLRVVCGGEESLATLLVGSQLLHQLLATSSSSSSQQELTATRQHLLDMMVKVCLSGKKKLREELLQELAPLLHTIIIEEFRSQLLPAMNKAILRSPEIALLTVSHILAGLSHAVDLSGAAAAELGKTFASNLKSKDDATREDATKAILALGRQCGEEAAAAGLLRQVFAVLNGSEGKITIPAHKASLLLAAGHMASTGRLAGPAVGGLASLATELLVKFLETESNEATIILALEMLALWAAKYVSELPATLVSWWPKGMSAATASSSVRCAYLLALQAGINATSVQASALPLVPHLLKVVETAAGGGKQGVATASAAQTEGVHAAACLLRMTRDEKVGLEADSGKLADFFIAVCDTDRHPFYTEKFLSSAGAATLQSLATLAASLLISRADKMNPDQLRGLLRALNTCLVSPDSAVRRHALGWSKKVGSMLGGADLIVHLLEDLGDLVSQRTVTADTVTRGEVGGGGDLPASGGDIPAGGVIGVLCGLVSGLAGLLSPEDRERVCLAALVPAHPPAMAVLCPSLWPRLVKMAQLDLADLLDRYQVVVLGQLQRQVVGPSPALAQEIVKTLVRHRPGVVLPHVLANLTSVLSDRALLSTTVAEYQTYLTPAGELYDKSVIESIKAESTSGGNIRRENKAYSYKEQMEEIALRKELEEKKRREGKLKAPELTPKQKEVMKAQLEKEATIRNRVADLLASCRPALCLFDACLESGRPEALAADVTDLLPVVYRALQSPLVAGQLSATYSQLRRSVFTAEDETLAQHVAGVTLQILKPACENPFAWDESQLRQGVLRALDMVHASSVSPKQSEDEEEEEDNSCPLSAPAFAYCFPLIREALRANVSSSAVVTKGLEIITEHTGLRGSEDEEERDSDMFHPRYLPRADILRLLVDLIGRTDGSLQQSTVKCLIDAAEAASGAAGCATAGPPEVECLLGALQSECDAVRDAALRGLIAMVKALPQEDRNEDDDDLHMRVVRRCWVARADPLPENRLLADQLWEAAGLSAVPGRLTLLVLEDVAHPVSKVRSAASEALAKLLEEDQALAGTVLSQLLATYQEKLIPTPPVVDSLGRIVEPAIDHWEPRSGIALALARIAPFYTESMVIQTASFFIPQGLGDRSEAVRKDMLNAAVVTIDLHGKATVGRLLPVFEDFLDSAPTDKSYDTVRQSVVILMGGLARHLDKDDPKVRPIIGKLISALATPSQQVQEAVANCLPPLVPSVKDEAPKLVSELLNTLLTTENFGERKGAAYGLAGLVKGLGILALKQLDIMNRLTEALQDKKNARHREGALFALSQLCSMLGRLFEPYIVHVLPHLLLCFGDANQYVREATDDCAKAVMSKLSAHGVKLVLPSLLAALEEDQWRTKTGSVELLGAMAYCAPKQLSSCLPSIVPKLIEVLGDSHQKVQNAGAQALKQIGSVIRNPEIQAIVPILLSALQDPAKKTGICLQTLLQTQFVHFIDAPSLALIMPAVQRAFQDRSTETRKMAAQIIGNMYSLTDQKDLAPYLPGIIPGLKASLLDPVPEVRAVSARALGAMVRGMGEASFEELLPWLMSTLTSESSSVDRSGAAQGLAEVVGGLGVDKMHKLMPEIVSTAERMDIAPHVKDGYIMMFIYMPGVFPEEFLQYIGQAVQPILRALADENEYVRETALKAGQRIVNMYAESAIMLLLPQLEQGLFDDNWRIRYSSVQLLGDLLYKISGVSGKMTTETASEDDNFGTEQGQKIITKMLGVDRRNRVLAGLYMGRSDVALMVRQAALHVWKVIVTNTPRTLREILPTLFNLLLGCLASNSYDKRQVAARTLGDLVRKLGERVLPEIIPILEQGLASDQPDKRQGVCVGLSEIIVSTSREMVLSFVNSLVPTVQRALCDSDPAVRMAAAKTFDSLHTTVGARALDDILPHMLEQLSDPEKHEDTLDGLRQVMAIKSRVVLPYLVPQLTATPVNTKALSILASVAGEALNRHLARILPALLTSLADTHGGADEAQELQYCQAVVLSVTDEVGVSFVIDILLESCRSKETVTRRGAVTLLHAFCEQTKVDYYEYVPQLIRSLLLLMADTDEGVLQEAWNALNAVTKTLDANAQLAHVADVRQAVRFAVSEVKDGGDLLPGFCLGKGIAPLLPIFRESILNGPPELKEQAAQGLGEVIRVTSPEALKPSVVHITGPLIRILGDRFSHNVKTAVLETLTILLGKASVMLKPFLPQLQTTFLKALNDTNRTVRLKAGAALAHLITIHTRPDPLYNELHTGIKAADEAAVRDTYIQALRGCVTSSGDKLSAVIRKPVTQSLLGLIAHPEDSSRLAAAGCLAALVRWLPEEERASVITDTVLDDNKNLDWTVRHGRSSVMFVLLHEAPEVIYTETYANKVIKTILSHISADRVPVAANGVRSAGFLMAHFLATKATVPSELVTPFTRAMNHTSNDVKILVAVMASYIAKRQSSLLPADLLKSLLPMLVNGTKEKNSLVKSSSESALVDLMQMRRGPSGQQQALSLLDPGMRESLTEVISKSLTKLATQTEAGETVIDETVLS